MSYSLEVQQYKSLKGFRSLGFLKVSRSQGLRVYRVFRFQGFKASLKEIKREDLKVSRFQKVSRSSGLRVSRSESEEVSGFKSNI